MSCVAGVFGFLAVSFFLLLKFVFVFCDCPPLLGRLDFVSVAKSIWYLIMFFVHVVPRRLCARCREPFVELGLAQGLQPGLPSDLALTAFFFLV